MSLLTDFAKKIIPDPEEPLDNRFFGSIQSYLSSNAAKTPNKIAVVDNRQYLFQFI